MVFATKLGQLSCDIWSELNLELDEIWKNCDFRDDETRRQAMLIKFQATEKSKNNMNRRTTWTYEEMDEWY